MDRVRTVLKYFAEAATKPSERIVATQALAALDEIEAAQPKWTREPPTKPGWYGYTSGTVVEVLDIQPEAPEDAFIIAWPPDYADHSLADLCGGLWLGPIPEPQKKEETTP